jgi:exosortase C (VPDSG-CTERM-specific)
METELRTKPENLKDNTQGNLRGTHNPLIYFALSVLVLCVIYFKPLADLMSLARSSLYSHVPLVPVISLYLVWIGRSEPAPSRFSRSPGLMLIPMALSMGLLGVLWLGGERGWAMAKPDQLFLSVSSFVLLVFASAFFFLGKRIVWSFAMPFALLFFMVPFPQVVENGIEAFFQHTSAEAAAIMLALAGAPVYREGLIFQLPGLAMEVGPQCSGIRSSLVLLITSLIAGYMFLRGPWKRAALTLFVIPLAILRNGFRIFTIGMLCIHVDPAMINSWVHKRGGPVFFALSLIPFFALLLWLRRTEKNASRKENKEPA